MVDNYYNLVRYVKDFDGVESATPVLGFCYPCLLYTSLFYLMSGFCGTAHEFVAQEVGVSIPVGTGGED